MFLIAHNVKDIRQSKLPNARQISGTIENSHKWINQSVAAMERLKSQVKILKNRLDCPDVARSKCKRPLSIRP